MESSFAQFKPITPESLIRINSVQPVKTRPKPSKPFIRKLLDCLSGTPPELDGPQPQSLLALPNSGSRDLSNKSRRSTAARSVPIVSKKKRDEEKKPNSAFEAGKKLPPYIAGYFPKKLAGVPIEDIDDYYADKKTFVVIASDKTIFRFSATDSFWLFSPLNPFRLAAIKVQVHPLFSAFILLAIVVNCVFMTGLVPTKEGNTSEITFTVIYTIETMIKALSRGFILADYTYLRDVWNWLDICVLMLAYLMFVSTEIGNMTSIRTLRVLRALKSVTALPGLRVIVSALMVGIQRLRGAMVLSIFVLSIFSLIGLQIYKGELTKKCVKVVNETWFGDDSRVEYYNWTHNPQNWMKNSDEVNNMTCGIDGGGACPEGYICVKRLHPNPNFGYTHFDHFGAALLCSFRLMTQDFWESLYQIVIRCNGQGHVFFFMLVIFFGSFYLINVILAIIAMAYGDCRDAEFREADEIRQLIVREEERRQREMENLLKEANSLHSSLVGSAEQLDKNDANYRRSDNRTMALDEEDEEEEEEDEAFETERKSIRSDACAQQDEALVSLINKDLQNCLSQSISYSLPGSPTCRRRLSNHLKHALNKLSGTGADGNSHGHGNHTAEKTRLDSLSLPYADDSQSATPCDAVVVALHDPRSRTSSRASRSADRGRTATAASVSVSVDEPGSPTSVTFKPSFATKTEMLQAIAASNKSRDRDRDRDADNCISAGTQLNLPLQPQASVMRRGTPPTQKPRLAHTGKQGSTISFQSIPQVIVDVPEESSEQYKRLGRPEIETEDRNFLVDRDRDRDHDNLSECSSQNELALPHSRLSRKGSTASRSGSQKSRQLAAEIDRMRKLSASSVTPQDIMHMRKLLGEMAAQNDTTASLRGSDHAGADASAAAAAEEEAQDEEKRVKFREVLKRKLTAWLWDSWQCPPCWPNYVQRYVALFVLDPFVDLFITICIVINTLFLALDHDGMTVEMGNILKSGNYFFTATFAIEAFLKLIALSPPIYFKDPWATFDFVIVVLSLVELPFEDIKGLSVLRSFRLLRVFKLAKSWTTLNTLLQIIAKTMGALGNLSLVLLIIVFIFAVVGMQLFGENYIKQCKVFDSQCNPSDPMPIVNEYLPRWNFIDFWHAFMVVFRVLCGEYIESMWDCMRVNDWYCLPFFIATMIIGNLVLLKLFLALLLSAFGGVSEKRREEEEGDADANKLQEAIDRIKRFVTWVQIKFKKLKKYLHRRFRTRKTRMYQVPPVRVESVSDGEDGAPVTYVNSYALASTTDARLHKIGSSDSHRYSLKSPSNLTQNNVDCNGHHAWASNGNGTGNENGDGVLAMAVDSESTFSGENDGGLPINPNHEPEATEVDVVYWNAPDDCLPHCLALKFKPIEERIKNNIIFRMWWAIRATAYKVVVHKYFETFIIMMIVCSSASLALEDKYLPTRKTLQEILHYLDTIFNLIFFSEMILKWFAFGLTRYFTDAWCWVDFICVAIACVSMTFEGSAGSSNVGALKAMRTLRALRPLRAVSRWEGMRVVVNALFQAIPSILNVMLVCLVFWLIFSIIGVQFFSGKFYKCIYTNRTVNNRVPREIVESKVDCLNLNARGELVEWKNSDINFDNVPNAYLALLQVATFKGWMEIMADAVDIVGKDHQPGREQSLGNYAFFVLFIIFGSFFTMNLFIGVIIDNFNVQKRKVGVSLEMFMTDDQKKYYKAMKRLSSKKPMKPVPKPKFKLGVVLYNIVTSQKFDVIIITVIMLNTIAMCIEHEGQSEQLSIALDYLNYVFTAVFTLEFVMKIFALRWYYFKYPWNVFDMLVVALSIAGTVSQQWFEETLKISPTLIRIVRVFRVSRVLRLVKAAKGIRTLLFSLMVSLPALFNIALLLFLVIFIYSIVGVSFFKDVKQTAGLDDMFNFETVPRAFILLFQITTSAGWNGVLAAIANEVDCDKALKNDCGNKMIAIPYLVSFLVMTFLVIVNMYIAVILENFSQATEEVSTGLTQDDFDMYYEAWEEYDPKARGYIPLAAAYEFLDKLDDPLKVEKPNHFKVAILNVPICTDDMINCVDLLDILTRHVLGTSDELEMKPVAEVDKIKKDYHVISNTMQRYKEDRAARKIVEWFRELRAWKGAHQDLWDATVERVRSLKSSVVADNNE